MSSGSSFETLLTRGPTGVLSSCSDDSSARGTVLELMDQNIGGPLIIFMDPPRQTRLRNLVSQLQPSGLPLHELVNRFD